MNKTKIQDCEYEYIADLYKSGLSIEKLENMYNVSNSVIRRILKLCNVKTRDNSHKGRKYQINENYFDVINTPNKAYILGLLYADGCNYTKLNTIKIELQERDKAILDKICLELEYNKPLEFSNLNKKNEHWQNTYKIVIVNKHMSNVLNNIGMVPRKSLTLIFPESLDKHLIHHFIRGYLDGDGHIEWSKTKFISIASSKEFCESIKELISNELSINSSIYDTHNKESNTKVLHICGKLKIKKFLDYIYNDAILFIDRKYNIYKTICNEII